MLQHDEYGFIIGDKRIKELQGDVAQIDKTTQEILAVLQQNYSNNVVSGRRELSHLEQLIELSKKQNKTIISISSINQYRANQPQNHPTNPANTHKLTARDIASEHKEQGDKQNLQTSRLTNATPKNPRERQRDSNGRFVGEGQSRLVKVMDKVAGTISMVNADMQGISPELDALHEINEVISPARRAFTMMGRGASWLFGRKPKNNPLPKEQKQQNIQDTLHQREERRLLRLILQNIGNTSWLSRLLSLLPGAGGGFFDEPNGSKRGRQGWLGGLFDRRNKHPKRPHLKKNNSKFTLPKWLKLPSWMKTSNFSKLSAKLGKLPTWVKGTGLLGLTLSATELLNWKNMSVNERGGAVGGIVGGMTGGWAGGLAGATAGATLGSIVPFVGTAVGGIIGGVVGSLGGAWLGSDLGRVIGDRFAPHGTSFVKTVITHSKTIGQKVSTLTTTASMMMAVSVLKTHNYLLDLGKQAWQVMQDGLSKVADFMTTLTAFAKSGLEMSLGWFGGLVSNAISSLDGLYQSARQLVSNGLSEVGNYLSEKVSGIGNFLSQKLSSLTGFIMGGGDGMASTNMSSYDGNYTLNGGTVSIGKWSKKLKANQFDKLAPMIAKKAVENGIRPETLLAFANIESSFNPDAQNTNYGGLFQINKKQHKNWRDPTYNTDIALKLMKENKNYYHKKFGQNAEWNAGLAYLYHQQGMGGATELLKNPNMSAAAALKRTKQWQNKSLDWIWHNIVKVNGGREGMTAKEFTDMWMERSNVLEDAYRKQGKYSATSTKFQDKTKQVDTVGVGIKKSDTSYAKSKTKNSTLDRVVDTTKHEAGIGVKKTTIKATNFVDGNSLLTNTNNTWVDYANVALSVLGVQTDKVFFKSTQPVAPRPAPMPSVSQSVSYAAPTNTATIAVVPTLSQEVADGHLARLLSGGYASS